MMYAMYRLLSMMLLLSLLFSGPGRNGISPVSAQQSSMDTVAETSEEVIKRAILEAISAHDDVMGFIVFDILVKAINVSPDGDGAIAELYYVDKETAEVIPSEPGLALGQKMADAWRITLQADEGWNSVLADLPDALLSDEEKSFWTIKETPQVGATKAFGGYKLPWAAGQSHALYRSITHPSPEQYAFDFGENGNQFELKASKGGIVWFAQWTYADGYYDGNCNHANYLVIKDTSTSPETFVIYLHLKQNSIPDPLRTRNAPVSQGQTIGVADDTGCSTASHVHIQLHTNPNSWYGTSQDMTFDDVPINGGRPRTPSEASAYGGQGQTWYTSQNGTVNCNNPSPNSDQIGLYSDENYCGTAKILGVGEYSSPGNMGFPNDSLSSIKVGSNVRAQLCKDDNYAGGCEDFNGDDSRLGDNGIGDNSVSSVKVIRKNNCSPNGDQVAFFTDANYGGNCVVRGIGNYPDPGSMGIPNDSLSSVRVGGNVRLSLYGDSNYQSTSETFTGDDSDLSNNSIGNDRASSAKVETRGNSLPPDYGFCAEEGQTCAFSGTAQIYYGANNQFVGPVTKTDGVNCSNDVFGDPIGGTHKACYIKGGRPAGSTFCANENGTCSFGSTKVATVFYGVNGKYNRRDDVSSSIACNNSTFGDPFSGLGKACYYIITGDNLTAPSNPNPADNTTLSRTNNTVLSYSTNGSSCTIHIWGGSIDISPSNNCSSLTLGNQRGGAYNWQVTASNGSGSITGPIWHFNIQPHPPSNLSIGSASDTQVTLNWTLSSDEPEDIEEYEIYQNDEYIGYVTNGISTYTVTGLSCNNSYSFYVKAKRQGVLSDATNTVTRGAVGCVPAMPGNLTVGTPTLHSLTLNWQDNSTNESGFQLYRWGHNGVDWGFYYLATVGANVRTYTQTGLVCGSDFNFYEVSAFNATGESEHTGWVQGATSPCPDLTPYPRSGRANPVIASPVAGTVTDGTLFAGEMVYFDWGFTNQGNAAVNASYYVDLYIDEQRFIHYPFNSLGIEGEGGFDDWSETWDQPGWHTVKLVVDPEGTIPESNEDNNIWTADFYWEPAPNDSYEPDDIQDQAKSISPNSSQSHSIIPATDIDWIKFTLNTASAITLETTGPTFSDTQMWLYDADLNLLQYSDDEGSGLYSLIRLNCGTSALQAGTYYIRIGEYAADEEILSYNLSFSTPSCSTFDVSMRAAYQGTYDVSIPGSTRVSLAGVDNGPVQIVNMDEDLSIAAERVIYRVNGVPTSFSEIMGLPDRQLSNIYWLPWYNNVGLDTQLRFANVSNSLATVHVYIGEDEMPGSPFSLGPGESTRKSFPGIDDGPVKIESNVAIVAAERVIYKVDGVPTSFSEMMALPNEKLDNKYWLPWYNNVGLDTQLRLANVSTSTATVRVFIGGEEMEGSPFTLAPGASIRKSFPGVDGGPVEIRSTQNIVAAERVIYKVGGVNTSFTELMSLPDSQLDTTYWLPWYNNIGLNSQLRFANVSSSTATVHVYIQGVEMIGSPFTLAPGESIRQSFAGIDDGPVQVVSNVPIVAAERVIYRVSGMNTSFSEIMGLPESQLDSTYWLPWYNNIGLDSQLRFGVP